jgi:putative membrane protein
MMRASTTALVPNAAVDQESLPEPLVLLHGLSQYMARLWQKKLIDTPMMNTCLASINGLTDAFSAAERIISTPIPVAYSIHMKQAVYMYCIVLPLSLVDTLEWYAVLLTAIVAFTLLGIDGIGSEIEQPFGEDANDLPLDDLCDVLKDEVACMEQCIMRRITDEMVDEAFVMG